MAEFLNQPIYSGHIEVEKWDISLRKGRHEALITLETYYAIPERLHGKPRDQRVRISMPISHCAALSHVAIATSL